MTESQDRPLWIFKVGGSLLDVPDWPSRLAKLVPPRETARCAVVIGGGPAADVVRDWANTYGLSEEAAHWLAIDSLTLTARLAETIWNRDVGRQWDGRGLVPTARIVGNRAAADAAWLAGELPIVELSGLLRGLPAEVPTPPHSWDVTSDSLAGWLAGHWSAAKLVLVKSAPLPEGVQLVHAPLLGLVDAYFPQLARQLPEVDWCDLRTSPARPVRWLAPHAAPSPS